MALKGGGILSGLCNRFGSTSVIENSALNFRNGSEAEIQTLRHYRKAPAKAIAAAPERPANENAK